LPTLFLIISWVLTGAVFGSVGVAWIASALSDGPRPDPNLDAIFLSLFLTTMIGAVGGGILAGMARRKFAGNKRRLDQLALLPFLAAVALVGYATFKS
jgi:ABC-type Fe3+ transport system permease subunit